MPYNRSMIKKSVRGPLRIAARVAKSAARNAASYAARSIYRNPGVVTRNRMRGIKQTIMRMKETKFVDFFWGKHELYHAVYNIPGAQTAAFYQLNTPNGCLPAQGDGDSNRNGNDIYARGIQVKMMLGCKQDRHNTNFRILVFKTSKGYDRSAYTQVFDNQTGNVMLDGVDKDRVSVVFDKKVSFKPINPSPDGKEITIFRKFWIPHKTLYKFYDDGQQGNSYPYDVWMVVMAYDAYGTLTTDNIAYVQTWSRFYFKDK